MVHGVMLQLVMTTGPIQTSGSCGPQVTILAIDHLFKNDDLKYLIWSYIWFWGDGGIS